MKLIIDISETAYNLLNSDKQIDWLGAETILEIVAKGTPYEEQPIEPKRKFIRIITTYYPDDIVCYEEYKGKPYFSIEYQENGETFIGYGTYNPDVLSRYLRDYFFS
jgi:hypothetical protein